MGKVNYLDWHGCYGSRWSGLITTEAQRHPAKFSRGLIERIYHHLLEQSYLCPGNTVIDPFGGVALGAWPAQRLGLNWLGVEIEQHFVDLGQANLELWQQQYSAHLPQWGQAGLLHGDSRRLSDVLDNVKAEVVVSSPPFGQGCAHHGGADTPQKASNKPGPAVYGPGCTATGQPTERYGASDGQLAGLPEGTLAIISSSPYESSVNQPPSANDAKARLERMRRAGIDNKGFWRRLHEKKFPHLAIDWEVVLIMRRT